MSDATLERIKEMMPDHPGETLTDALERILGEHDEWETRQHIGGPDAGPTEERTHVIDGRKMTFNELASEHERLLRNHRAAIDNGEKWERWCRATETKLHETRNGRRSGT